MFQGYSPAAQYDPSKNYDEEDPSEPGLLSRPVDRDKPGYGNVGYGGDVPVKLNQTPDWAVQPKDPKLIPLPPKKEEQGQALQSQAASTGANSMMSSGGGTPWGLIASALMTYKSGVDKISKKRKIGVGDMVKVAYPAQGGMFGSSPQMAIKPGAGGVGGTNNV